MSLVFLSVVVVVVVVVAVLDRKVLFHFLFFFFWFFFFFFFIFFFFFFFFWKWRAGPQLGRPVKGEWRTPNSDAKKKTKKKHVDDGDGPKKPIQV